VPDRPATQGRLASLDAFRGLTIAAMILVNNPGDWSCVYWPLLHVSWHGWTPTDLIYPFFLFMVGMSLSFSRRLGLRPALVRASKLIGLGLLLRGGAGETVAAPPWSGRSRRRSPRRLLRKWARPFVTYGKNAIAVYVGSGIVADTLYAIRWAGPDGVKASLWERLSQALYGSWLPCEQASLAWAISVVVLFARVAWWMDRRGIYLKV